MWGWCNTVCAVRFGCFWLVMLAVGSLGGLFWVFVVEVWGVVWSWWVLMCSIRILVVLLGGHG